MDGPFLTRVEASEALKEEFGSAGYLTPASLAKYACIGCGPPMLKIGRKVAYQKRDLLDWGRGRIRLVTRDL